MAPPEKHSLWRIESGGSYEASLSAWLIKKANHMVGGSILTTDVGYNVLVVVSYPNVITNVRRGGGTQGRYDSGSPKILKRAHLKTKP